MSAPSRPWYVRPRWLLLLAVATHLLCVLAVPRLVMMAAMQRLATVAGGINVAHLAPPTGADSRRIVMPSPDLRYALCVYDLAKGPVEVATDPHWPAYWSVALYDARTDNYRAWNDRQLNGRGLRLLLVRDESTVLPGYAGAVVVAPSRRGVVLMRLLVTGQPQHGRDLSPRVLSCAPHSDARG